MDPLDLPTLAAYAGGTLRGGGDLTRTVVREISTDSRTVGPGELFLALRGERFDGHGHVAQAVARGALGAVVARDFLTAGSIPAADVPAGFAWIEVTDTLEAYQEIAAHYRRAQLAALRVVGITGSNGKTSTKDFAAAVLGRRFAVLKTEGNLNNHVGVPRMVLRASAAAHEVAVLEMGMNHPGEIAPLARIARPDVGIITNVGTAHLEFMGTRAAIAQEKGMLAEALDAGGTLVLFAEDEFTASLAARTAARVVTVGVTAGDLRAVDLQPGLVAGGSNGGGSRFTVVDTRDGQRAEVALAVPGTHMVVNALLAAAAGRALGMNLAECAAGLADARLTRGRLERKTRGGLNFLDDSYNANPDSMTAALRTLASLPVPPPGRRLAVLGRMGELGDAAPAGYRQVGERVAAEGLDALVTVGPEAEAIGAAARAGGLRSPVHAVGTTAEAARLLRAIARPGDLILLKGSRSAALETVLDALDPAAADDDHHAPGCPR